MADGYRIEVTGLREIFDALDKVDKKASDAVKREVTKAGQKVSKAAKAQVPGRPVRHWGPWISSDRGRDLSFDAAEVASKIHVQRSNFKKRGVARGIGWDVINGSAAGAIFEVMGDGSRVTDDAGRHLVAAVNRKFPGKQPRLLLPAYYEGLPENLKDDIRDLILAEAKRAGLI